MPKQKGKLVKVIKSFNNESENLCVDIFVRPDGSWGFEQYRRDYEEGIWFPISSFKLLSFNDEASAYEHAKQKVGWLELR